MKRRSKRDWKLTGDGAVGNGFCVDGKILSGKKKLLVKEEGAGGKGVNMEISVPGQNKVHCRERCLQVTKCENGWELRFRPATIGGGGKKIGGGGLVVKWGKVSA